MKKNLILFSVLMYTIIMSSCNTTLYVPNAVNAPLLKEKNEVKFSIGPNNFQAAYALSSNVGIIGNAFWDNYKAEVTSGGITTETENKGNLFELGVGYFKPLSENIVFETYVGGGLGKIDFSNDNTQKYYDVDATKFFVQPAIGYVSKIIDVAFTPRFSAVKYNSLNARGYTQAELDEEYLNKGDVEDKTWMFIEPAITARVGFKYVKLQAQIGFASKLTSGDLKYESKFSSLGVSVNIAKWYNN